MQSHQNEHEYSIDAVHCSLMERCDEQVARLNSVKSWSEILQKSWRAELTILDKYSAYDNKLVSMRAQVQCLQDGYLDFIKAVKHRIELYNTDSLSIQSASFLAGLRREFGKQEIRRMRMLAREVIEPYQRKWASPTVFVSKKDCTLHFCADFQKLNAVMIWDSYQTPCLDEWIASPRDAAIFLTLDVNSGYLQVQIAQEDRNKTTSKSHHGLFRFTWMSFLDWEMPQEVVTSEERFYLRDSSGSLPLSTYTTW